MKFVTAVLLASSAAWAQQAPGPQTSRPLTDQRIIELVHSGVSADELIRLIQTAPQVNFDLSPTGDDTMLQAGVSQEVIKAMSSREQGVNASEAQTQPALEPAPNAPAASKASRPSDDYIHRGSKEIEFSGAAFFDHTSAGDAFGVGAARLGVYVARNMEVGGDFTFAGGSGLQMFLPAGFFAMYSTPQILDSSPSWERREVNSLCMMISGRGMHSEAKRKRELSTSFPVMYRSTQHTTCSTPMPKVPASRIQPRA